MRRSRTLGTAAATAAATASIVWRDDLTYAGTAMQRLTTACAASAWAAARLKVMDDADEAHKLNAGLMYRVAAAHGGLYNKTGQYASTMQMLPRPYTQALGQLVDKAGSEPWSVASATLRRELGPSFGGFAWVETKPVAAASLAQVHRAVTADGRRVALKIQKSSVQRDMVVDLATFRLLLRVLAELFPERDFTWMLPELEKVLTIETDFVQEGIQARRAAALCTSTGSGRVRQHVAIPDIWWPGTSTRTLCTDWVDGVRANDLQALRALGVRPDAVADVAVRFFAEQTFVTGLLHLDPHVGNVLVSVPTHVQTRLDPAVRAALFRRWPAAAEAASSAPAPNPDALHSPAPSMSDSIAAVGTALQHAAISLACLPALLALGLGAGCAVVGARTARAFGQGMEIKELSRGKRRASEEITAADSQDDASVQAEPEAELAQQMRVDDSTASLQGIVQSHAAAVQSAAPLPQHGHWNLQVLDHGMYRRLDPPLRAAYAQLWYSILIGDTAQAARAVQALGLPEHDRKRYAEVLSLVLLFRPTGTGGATAGALTAEQRAALRSRFQAGGDLHIASAEVSAFMQRLPQDIWIAMRNANIVRGLNKDLGGTTSSRALAMMEAAIRGSRVPVSDAHPRVLAETIGVPSWTLDPARQRTDAQLLNLQVDAEVNPAAAARAQLGWSEWAWLTVLTWAARTAGPKQRQPGQGKDWG